MPLRNGALFQWCLGHGLRVVQVLTLMTTGLYNEPAGGLPAIGIVLMFERVLSPRHARRMACAVRAEIVRGLVENYGVAIAEVAVKWGYRPQGLRRS